MTDQATSSGETPRFLVRIIQPAGHTAHIPTSDGDPICKLKLKISLWQIEECPLTPTLLCNRCAAMQTNQVRSSAVPLKQPSAPLVANDIPHEVGMTSYAALVLASITQQNRYLYSSHPSD